VSLSNVIGTGITGLAGQYLADRTARATADDANETAERIAFAQISANAARDKSIILYGGIGLALFFLLRKK